MLANILPDISHILRVSFLPLFYPYVRYLGLSQYHYSPPSGIAFRHHLYPRRPLIPKSSGRTYEEGPRLQTTVQLTGRFYLSHQASPAQRQQAFTFTAKIPMEENPSPSGFT